MRTIAPLLFLLVACSSELPDESTAADAIVADWIHPACDASALGPPLGDPGQCNGPWRYSYDELWRDRAACGEDRTQACEVRNACTSWDASSVGDGLGIVRSTWVDPPSEVFTWTLPFGWGTQPSVKCAAMAQARRQQVGGWIAAGAPAAATSPTAFYVTGAIVEQHVGPVDPEPPHYQDITYRCQTTVHGFPSQRTDPRGACSCGQYPPAECVRFTATALTAPGQIKPSTGGPPGPGSTSRRIVAGSERCTTCDAIAIDTAEGTRAKLECLDDELELATGDQRSSIAARMMLLHQVAGEHLTPAQRDRVHTIYNTHLEASPVCRIPVEWQGTCRAAADPLALPGQLQLCRDLVDNPAASTGTAAAELAHCTGVLASTGALPEVCNVPARELADDATRRLMADVDPSLIGAAPEALARAVQRFEQWWAAARTASRGDRAWFEPRASGGFRALWSRIYGALSTPATDGEAAALLAGITNAGFANDIALIAARFAAGQPAGSPALLTLVGDALQGISDRVHRLSAIHDVGCRLAPCRTAGGLRASATTELIRVLAALPDPALLVPALAAASHLAAQQPALVAALRQIRDQLAYLSDAWAQLGRSEPFSALAELDDPPAEAAGLAAIVRAARVAWSSYQASGALVAAHRTRLTAAALNPPALLALVDNLKATLVGANAVYADARLATVNDLLADAGGQGTARATTARIEGLYDQMRELAVQGDALRVRDDGDRSRAADFHAAFERIVESGSFDPAAAYQVQTVLAPDGAPWRVRGSSARYPAGSVLDLERDRFTKVTLGKGESLRIHVTGQWAPDCALVNARLSVPGSEIDQRIDGQPSTGPEGYWVSWSSGRWKAESSSHTEGWERRDQTSVELCGSLFGFGGCAWKHDDADVESHSATDASGNETRSSVNFTSGLRLEQTPVKSAPAGSLVAVVTRAGAIDPVLEPRIDVRVVGRDDVIVAPAIAGGGAVDVHLIVNDTAASAGAYPCHANQDALQLEMVKVIPAGSAAIAFGRAAADALQAIEDQAPALIGLGAVPPSEVSALRATAWTTVQQRLGAAGLGIAGLPQDLRQLFEGYLDREVASVARRAEMMTVRRGRRRIGTEIDALDHERSFLTEQNRLRALVPRWRLRDLAGSSLAQATGELAEAITSFVAPVFALRDPAAFSTLPSQIAGGVDPLIDVSITAPFETTIDRLIAVTGSLRTALAFAELELPTTSRRTVVVAIPRAQPYNSGDWRQVSPAAARAFWDAVNRDGGLSADAVVRVVPADLYTPGGGSARFSCGELAPIVRHVALYFDTGEAADRLDAAGHEVPARAATRAPVTFPVVGGTIELEPSDPLGVPFGIRAFNGHRANVLLHPPEGTLPPFPDSIGAGAGVAPFTSFSLDMRSFGTGTAKAVFDRASALLLVFEVERRFTTASAWLPGICSAGP